MTDDGGARPPTHLELSGTATGRFVQAHSVRDVHFHQPDRSRPPVPFQVPAPPKHVAGRDRELTELTDWLAAGHDGPRTIVLTGTAGVGKTTLAAHWLGTLRAQYPDGILFTDLGRTSPEPVSPSDALEGFLLSLGIDSEQIPVDDGQRETLYRSVTAERRLAVLLDNALSATQVRPLLPAGDHCVVVVTSRFRLSGLRMDGADWFDVDPLDVAGSSEVLRRMLGTARVEAEPASASDLVELCSGLPLALSIVGARLATRPKRRLVQEAAALRVERQRLTSMALSGDASVEAVFDSAYADLPDDATTVYRLCARHPGPGFGPGMAAAALDWNDRRTESAVDELLEANLLVEVDDSQVAYHDLLRIHAQQRSEHIDPAELRQSTLRRSIEWYLDQTVHADLRIHPHRPRIGSRYATATRDRFGTEQEALHWLESHRTHVVSAVEIAALSSWNDLVWQLCEALWGFFLHTRHYRDWIRMHELGIAASQRGTNPKAEAKLRSQLGFAYAKLRRYDEAAAENTVALRIAEQEHDIQGMATATSQLGRAAKGKGDLEAALRHYAHARQLQQQIGQWRGVALCRRRIGQILSRLDRHDEAREELTAACTEMRELGDTTQQARTLGALAQAHVRAGQADDAEPCLREALSLMRDLGSPYYQAEILAQLGDLAAGHGDHKSAVDSYRMAAELYELVQDPAADVMRTRLSALTDQS